MYMYMYIIIHDVYNYAWVRKSHDRGKSSFRRLHFFMLFKVAFSLLINSLFSKFRIEGSVMEMKPTALVQKDTAVS